MQTQFKFHYATYDFIFEKEHRFECEVGDSATPYNSKYGLESLKFVFRIKPEKHNNKPSPAQTGSLLIRIPLSKDPAEEIILHLLHIVVEQINFNNTGKFEVAGGLYTGERIPETEEEKEYVGDKPFFAKLNLVEHVDSPVFNPTKFASQVTQPSMDMVLIKQHNHAAQTSHPIDKFVSYYKIIEDLLYTKSNSKAKTLLNNSELLKTAYMSAFDITKTNIEYFDFVSKIIDIRHNCSHLKRDSDFGYVINDARIESEVETQLDLMHYITYQLIINNAKNV